MNHIDVVTRGTYEDVVTDLVVMAKEVIDAVEAGKFVLEPDSGEIINQGEVWRLWVSVYLGYNVVTSDGKALTSKTKQEDISQLPAIGETEARLLAYSFIGWLRSAGLIHDEEKQ